FQFRSDQPVLGIGGVILPEGPVSDVAGSLQSQSSSSSSPARHSQAKERTAGVVLTIIERRAADPVAAAGIRCRRPRFLLHWDRNDLIFGGPIVSSVSPVRGAQPSGLRQGSARAVFSCFCAKEPDRAAGRGAVPCWLRSADGITAAGAELFGSVQC